MEPAFNFLCAAGGIYLIVAILDRVQVMMIREKEYAQTLQDRKENHARMESLGEMLRRPVPFIRGN